MNNKLAVLGPKLSFSDIAADKYLSGNGEKISKFFAKDMDEIFELVQKGKVKEGIIPIENMINGVVRETLDFLFAGNIRIIKEIKLPIHHCLAALPNSKGIKTVISHSQALNQCKKYLKKKFPKAAREAVSSTTASIEKLIKSKDKTLAVIVPQIAAEKNHLKILAKNIEDNHDNSTTFIVIKKGEYKPKASEQKNSTKVSIAFYFKENKAGTLFGVFQIFAAAHINLTKIESRPTKALFGEYVFYLDFEGNINSEKVRSALKKVKTHVSKLKILGAY